ncbi:MAG: hypothetical protein AAB584_02095 [Patescibacteria group bacterium]
MSFEEYIKTKHPTPYLYLVKKNGQFLYYFGATHSFDPAHPQFKLLEKQWRNFIEKTKKQNCILLIETRIKKNYIKDRKNAILKNGEPGFTVYFAKKDKIDFKCPEPSIKQQVKDLLNSYELKEIIYFYFIRIMAQWYKLKSRPEFKKYTIIILRQLKKELNWLDFDFSLENIKKIHKSIFKEELNENSEKTIREAASPVEYNSVINEISRKNSMFRNRYIVREIKKLWNKKKNIFVVYGSAHAVVQKKELEKLENKSVVRNGRRHF